MAPDLPEADARSSLARARRINEVCEQFEAAWRGGERPEIAALLEMASTSDRSRLFCELLALELELRRDRKERPGVDEYVARFPDRREAVVSVFAEDAVATAVFPGGGGAFDRDADMARTTTRPSCRIESPTDAPLGQIGDYELLEELARGGMGVVYKARHRVLKRTVALKMILSGPTATAAERQRFRREAELSANLDHPHIVPIYEVDEEQGHPFFSMKLVEGGSLGKQLSRYKNDPRAAAQLVCTLARAVHHAHGQGFLHCDLKPSNVLLDNQGHPYLTDFGLARRTGVDSSLSGSGAIMGTPSYMAPEQATGARARLGPTTDVYGLGAILYELLTGRPPFRAETIMETVVQVLERDPAPLREVRPEVPPELESICLKCLEKSPKERYASADLLAKELENYVNGDGIAATGIVSRLRRWNRREPELVARLGGLLLVAILTQFNYWFVTSTPDFRVHYAVQGVLALWAASAVVFQSRLRSGRPSDRVRIFWSAADIIFLTIELKLLDRFESTLLVGYPLLIAASGLWWRVRLVWITTALAMLAYAILYVQTSLHWHAGRFIWRHHEYLQYPNIFLAGLLITGYVVARQVRRILALSQYYENRPGI